MRVQARLGRYDEVIADRHVVKQLHVAVVADVNVVAALLDRRIIGNALYAIIRTAAEQTADLDVTGDLDLAGIAGTDVDVAGASDEVDIGSPVDRQGPLECAFRGGEGGQRT